MMGGEHMAAHHGIKTNTNPPAGNPEIEKQAEARRIDSMPNFERAKRGLPLNEPQQSR
jgi:hypothetical protein